MYIIILRYLGYLVVTNTQRCEPSQIFLVAESNANVTYHCPLPGSAVGSSLFRDCILRFMIKTTQYYTAICVYLYDETTVTGHRKKVLNTIF